MSRKSYYKKQIPAKVRRRWKANAVPLWIIRIDGGTCFEETTVSARTEDVARIRAMKKTGDKRYLYPWDAICIKMV